MGQGLLRFWKEKLDKEDRIALVTGFLMTFFIHIFKFTNTLPNQDYIYNIHASQNVIGSGRWALRFACGISSDFDLPWFNGLLCCIYIALTVMLVVRLLRIKNPVIIALCAGFIGASPATVETFTFMFTADGYLLAMVLSALAAYCLRIPEDQPSRRTSFLRALIGGTCICISCGIYQAYVSFALVLSVCYFLCELLENRFEKKAYFRWIGKQVLVYILALAAYYIIWKAAQRIFDVSANSYQGIDQVGTFRPDFLQTGIVKALDAVKLHLFQLAPLRFGFSLYTALNLVFLGALAAGLLIAVVKSGALHRVWALVLVILCLLAIVPFACMWHFASDSVFYRPLMLQSLALLFVLGAVLYERWTGCLLKNLMGLLLALIVFNNALLANIAYYYQDLGVTRTLAGSVELMVEINDVLDGREVKRIAIVGDRYNEMHWELLDKNGKYTDAGRAYIVSSLTEATLLVNADEIHGFLKHFMGMDLQKVSASKTAKIAKLEEVKQMPCWPADGALKVIDDTLVLKLSDT